MSSRIPPHSSSTAERERRPGASNSYTSSTRPRVPSSSMPAENERHSERHSSSTSHARKQSSAMAPGERRIERREVREREVEMRRARSPLKHSTESKVNARSRTEKATRPAERVSGSASTARKAEETQGRLLRQSSQTCNG
jgi:gamma-tubulin complex component 2